MTAEPIDWYQTIDVTRRAPALLTAVPGTGAVGFRSPPGVRDSGEGHVAPDGTLLLRRLRSHDFSGPLWEGLRTELAQHGLDVLYGWIRSGTIRSKLKAAGRPVPIDFTRVPSDDAMEMALETVAVALSVFRETLRANRWNPDEGASIQTYFVGACINAFPNVGRHWRRQQSQDDMQVPVEDINSEQVVPLFVCQPRTPEQYVIEQEQLERVAGLSGRLRTIIALVICGYTAREIAEKLDMSVRSVEGRLYRVRREARDRLTPALSAEP